MLNLSANALRPLRKSPSSLNIIHRQKKIIKMERHKVAYSTFYLYCSTVILSLSFLKIVIIDKWEQVNILIWM